MDLNIFGSFQEITRVIVFAICVYFFVILGVRLVGKRSTSKMNNFDWIVTVALGSMVGSIILLRDVTLVKGFVAIGSLLGLQWLLTKVSAHVQAVRKFVHSPPTLVFFRGTFLEDAMKKERITPDEILKAVRKEGHHSLEAIAAVVLEPDGELSVLPESDSQTVPVLDNVKGIAQQVTET